MCVESERLLKPCVTLHTTRPVSASHLSGPLYKRWIAKDRASICMIQYRVPCPRNQEAPVAKCVAPFLTSWFPGTSSSLVVVRQYLGPRIYSRIDSMQELKNTSWWSDDFFILDLHFPTPNFKVRRCQQCLLLNILFRKAEERVMMGGIKSRGVLKREFYPRHAWMCK